MRFDQAIEGVIRRVPGWDQIAAGEYVLLEGKPEGAPRILFLGNSITWHGPKADIGWSGNWGMAASCRERDYVHLLMDRVLKICPGAAFCIVQGAVWERSLDQCDLEACFAPARNFRADIVCYTLGANVPSEAFEPRGYKAAMRRLLHYLGDAAHARFIIGTNFWNDAKAGAAREFARENDLPMAELSDLLIPEENRAVGLFEHQGVANHPGDLGMERIAGRIWEKMEPMLKEWTE